MLYKDSPYIVSGFYTVYASREDYILNTHSIPTSIKASCILAFILPLLIGTEIGKGLCLPLIPASAPDSSADLLGKVIIEIQIMKYAHSHSEYFLCLQKMTDICSAVSSGICTVGSLLSCTDRAHTALLYRSFIKLIFLIEKIHLSLMGIDMSMSSVS